MRLTTLGDLLLDVIVELGQPLVPGDDQVATTRTGAGGQAANVAAWARELGADSRFVGKRGDDAAGELVTRELAGRGVDVAGPVGGRTGVVVSLASDGDRTMASDRGAAVELAPHELESAWFDCDVLHISGYSLLRSPLAETAIAAAALARGYGATSLSTSPPGRWSTRLSARLRELEPDLVFANELEQEAVGPLDARWVLKRGAQGYRSTATTTRPWRPRSSTRPAPATRSPPASSSAAQQLGLEAAARCCAQLGAMP